MDDLISVALGIGLAAATGFRLFIPVLAAAVAARMGIIELTDGFAWLSSNTAMITLGTAAAAETLAYYIPGVDHLLDLVEGPLALVAGAIVSASVMAPVDPAIMWPIAIIAGGGIAGAAKGSSAVIRAKTGLMTAGLGNPVVSTAETFGAVTVSILAIALPVLALVAVIALLVWAVRKAMQIRIRPKT